MKKISGKEYYDLFNRWQVSGKSKAAFAGDEGISSATFYYWCRKFSLKEPANSTQSSFSVITPDPGLQREPVVRVSFPSGVSIEFFGKIEIGSVKELL